MVEVLGWEASEEPAGERRLITHGRSGEHDGAVLALELLAIGAGDDPDTDAARAVTGMADGRSVHSLTALGASASDRTLVLSLTLSRSIQKKNPCN